MSEETPTIDRICFVLSPIGREGTEVHQKFREVLEFVIVPAVEQAGMGLKVIRADDIDRPGSFIKDILQYIAGSFVVIADLTNQNPNVFYELGVRHSLSPRTILIAQELDDIPSDLREYRTIIYDTSAKGASAFKERVENFLREIREAPQRPDNPVLDRLGSVVGEQTEELEAEVTRLKSELDRVLRTGSPSEPNNARKVSLGRRLDRIEKIMGAKAVSGSHLDLRRTAAGQHRLNDPYTFDVSSLDGTTFDLPASEGNFTLRYITGENGSVQSIYYIVVLRGSVDFEEQLADIRVLMERYPDIDLPCTFVMVSTKDMSTMKVPLHQAFEQVKGFIASGTRDRFSLEVWDRDALRQKELDMGIKVQIPETS